MRQICVVLFALLIACANIAEAAKPKPSKPAPVAKPIYEAPMRVVIVRNGFSTCEPNCPEWIAAEGEITDATPQLFRRVFKQMGKRKLPVIIRSPGGSINAALIIGRMLRERGLTAAVGYTLYNGCRPDDTRCKLPPESKGVYRGMIVEERAFCNSACPMVLAGATTRLASPLTFIGLHKPRTIWMQEQVRYREFYRIVNGKKKVTSRKILSRKKVQTKTTYGLDKRLRKRLGDYYKTMGVDLAILVDTEKAEFKDIYFLPEDRKTSLKLRTTAERAMVLGDPQTCGSGATKAQCGVGNDKAAKPKPVTAALSSPVSANAMTFQTATLAGTNCMAVCPKWIVAIGEVTPDTPKAFATFLSEAAGGAKALVLQSKGGNAEAAMTLGRIIRFRGIETHVGHTKMAPGAKPKNQAVPAHVTAEAQCTGACFLVFAGGKERHVNDEPQIAVEHQSRLVTKVTVPAIDVQMQQYLTHMGIKPQFVSTLQALGTRETRFLSRAEVLNAGLGTDALDIVHAMSREHCSANPWAASCAGPAQLMLSTDGQR